MTFAKKTGSKQKTTAASSSKKVAPEAKKGRGRPAGDGGENKPRKEKKVFR